LVSAPLTHDYRGYAASREQAMADFKAWLAARRRAVTRASTFRSQRQQSAVVSFELFRSLS